MQETQDFILVRKVDINEGFSTGTITKACLFFTKKYMFVVPFESLSVLGYTATETKTNAADVLESIIPHMKDQTVEDFEHHIKSKIPAERIYEISTLETFTINVGWWIFGGMTVKKKGGARQTINVQPKDVRAQIAQFYA